MQTLKVKIIGTRPLLVHADVFADPLNKLTKAHKVLTSKRKKSDEDHELIARSEWRGGLYFADDIGPFLPGINIESSLVAGGKLSKMGTQLKRSVEIMDSRCPIIYEGPHSRRALGFRVLRCTLGQSRYCQDHTISPTVSRMVDNLRDRV